jgi:hypothetical protein
MNYQQIGFGIALLTPFIVGVVGLIKNLGVSGNYLILSDFVVGLVLGLLYSYSLSPMVNFTSWFWSGLFGLACGLLACGLYTAGQNMLTSAIKKSR